MNKESSFFCFVSVPCGRRFPFFPIFVINTLAHFIFFSALVRRCKLIFIQSCPFTWSFVCATTTTSPAYIRLWIIKNTSQDVGNYLAAALFFVFSVVVIIKAMNCFECSCCFSPVLAFLFFPIHFVSLLPPFRVQFCIFLFVSVALCKFLFCVADLFRMVASLFHFIFPLFLVSISSLKNRVDECYHIFCLHLARENWEHEKSNNMTIDKRY